MNQTRRATAFAVAAAALYAINVPLSKLLLRHIGSTMLAALLYLGAGIGLFLYGQGEKLLGTPPKREPHPVEHRHSHWEK